MKAWLCLKIAESINVGGVERKPENEHMIGVAPIFDDRNYALMQVGGSETSILSVEIPDKIIFPESQ